MKTGMKSPLCEFLVPATCLHLSHAWVNIFPVRMVGDIATRSGQSAECYEWAQWKTPSPCREPKNACLRVINFSLCTEWGTTGITLFFLFLLRLCFEEEKRKNHILRIWEFNMDFFFLPVPTLKYPVTNTVILNSIWKGTNHLRKGGTCSEKTGLIAVWVDRCQLLVTCSHILRHNKAYKSKRWEYLDLHMRVTWLKHTSYISPQGTWTVLYALLINA